MLVNKYGGSDSKHLKHHQFMDTNIFCTMLITALVNETVINPPVGLGRLTNAEVGGCRYF